MAQVSFQNRPQHKKPDEIGDQMGGADMQKHSRQQPPDFAVQNIGVGFHSQQIENTNIHRAGPGIKDDQAKYECRGKDEQIQADHHFVDGRCCQGNIEFRTAGGVDGLGSQGGLPGWLVVHKSSFDDMENRTLIHAETDD